MCLFSCLWRKLGEIPKLSSIVSLDWPPGEPGTLLFTLHPLLFPRHPLPTCSSFCALWDLSGTSVVGLVLPVPDTKAPHVNQLWGCQSRPCIDTWEPASRDKYQQRNVSCLLTDNKTIMRDQTGVKRQTAGTRREKDEDGKNKDSADDGKVENESMWGSSQRGPSGQ